LDDETKIKFKRCPFDIDVERHLGLIDGLQKCDVDYYRKAVQNREKGVFGVVICDKRVGSIIWCLTDEPKGRVFVIDEMAADCKSGIDFTAATNEMAHIFALQMNAKYLRFMTRRKGLIAKVGAEYETTYILEKAL